ncbi:SRPBCC domain-containing protein [Devosia sp.]|uniref:SRPBCC domain-containing protein n=1 Tax=Devosia sp. TaxID=1871048 RepID=UPI003A8D4241
MTPDSQTSDSFTIEKVYPHPRDTVWAAWAVLERKKAWFGDGLEQFDFRVGGRDRGVFSDKMGEHVNETAYFEISDRERIVYAYSMAMNGRVHTVSLVTVLFEDVEAGTRLRQIEQMWIMPPSDGVAGRRHGWQALLDNLGSYLEKAS